MDNGRNTTETPTLDALHAWHLLDQHKNELIWQARESGATWKQITTATGYTRDGAYKAYQKHTESLHHDNPHNPPTT